MKLIFAGRYRAFSFAVFPAVHVFFLLSRFALTFHLWHDMTADTLKFMLERQHIHSICVARFNLFRSRLHTSAPPSNRWFHSWCWPIERWKLALTTTTAEQQQNNNGFLAENLHLHSVCFKVYHGKCSQFLNGWNERNFLTSIIHLLSPMMNILINPE